MTLSTIVVSGIIEASHSTNPWMAPYPFRNPLHSLRRVQREQTSVFSLSPTKPLCFIRNKATHLIASIANFSHPFIQQSRIPRTTKLRPFAMAKHAALDYLFFDLRNPREQPSSVPCPSQDLDEINLKNVHTIKAPIKQLSSKIAPSF